MHVFILFLTNRNLLDQWMTNLLKDHRENYGDTDQELKNHVKALREDPRGIVSDSFPWAKTPENFGFWNGVDNEWMRIDQQICKILNGYKYE